MFVDTYESKFTFLLPFLGLPIACSFGHGGAINIIIIYWKIEAAAKPTTFNKFSHKQKLLTNVILTQYYHKTQIYQQWTNHRGLQWLSFSNRQKTCPVENRKSGNFYSPMEHAQYSLATSQTTYSESFNGILFTHIIDLPLKFREYGQLKRFQYIHLLQKKNYFCFCTC